MAKYNSFVFEGHGLSEVTKGFDPGATAQGQQEHAIAEKIVASAKKYLSTTNLNIHYDENNYSDNDLADNYYTNRCGIVVHVNAGGGSGSEIYVPLKEKYLASDFKIVANIAETLKIPNRGVKSRNYNTGNTSIRQNGIASTGIDYYKEIRDAWDRGISLSLLEVGFIDTSDLSKINANIDVIGFYVAQWVCDNSGITLTKPVISAETHKVICGSFKDRANAEQRVNELKAKGFDAFIESK